jgi:hypothetical protein
MKIPKDYKFDVYFNPRAASWSWATWKDRWEKADWEVEDFEDFKKSKNLQEKFNLGGGDMSNMLISQMEGKIDSWAIRWCYHHFKNDAFCVYPTRSYVNNIGLDGSGVHCGVNKGYNNNFLSDKVEISTPQQIKIDEEVIKNFRKVYKKNYIKKVAINFLKKMRIYKIYRKIKYKI